MIKIRRLKSDYLGRIKDETKGIPLLINLSELLNYFFEKREVIGWDSGCKWNRELDSGSCIYLIYLSYTGTDF